MMNTEPLTPVKVCVNRKKGTTKDDSTNIGHILIVLSLPKRLGGGFENRSIAIFYLVLYFNSVLFYI